MLYFWYSFVFPHLLYSLNLFPHHLHELVKVEFPISVHIVFNDKAEHLQIDQRWNERKCWPTSYSTHGSPIPSVTCNHDYHLHRCHHQCNRYVSWCAGDINLRELQIWSKNWQNGISFFGICDCVWLFSEWSTASRSPLCSSQSSTSRSSSKNYHVQLSTSSSVGFWPIERITGRSSLVEIVPLRS